MGLHGLEIVGTLQQMGALSTGVLRANRLAIETLCGHALFSRSSSVSDQAVSWHDEKTGVDVNDNDDDDMQGMKCPMFGGERQ